MMSSLGYLFCLPLFGLHLLCLPGSNVSETKTKKNLAQDFSLQLPSLFFHEQKQSLTGVLKFSGIPMQSPAVFSARVSAVAKGLQIEENFLRIAG